MTNLIKSLNEYSAEVTGIFAMVAVATFAIYFAVSIYCYNPAPVAPATASMAASIAANLPVDASVKVYIK